jgi:surfactin synthase thioesterase subunit
MITVDITSRWVRTWARADEATELLVCFPPSGLGASFFHTWPTSLAPRFQVVAARLPGREDRIAEEPPTSVEEIADAVTAAIGADPRPVTLVGVGSGTAMALQTAVTRRAAGGLVAGVIVAGGRPPHFVGADGDVTLEQGNEILGQTDDEIVASGCSCLPGLRSATDLDPWLLKRMLATFRATVRAVCEYRYEAAPLDCELAGWRGADDTLILAEHNRAWDRYTTGRFSTREFPGVKDYFGLGGVIPAALAEQAGLVR